MNESDFQIKLSSNCCNFRNVSIRIPRDVRRDNKIIHRNLYSELVKKMSARAMMKHTRNQQQFHCNHLKTFSNISR